MKVSKITVDRLYNLGNFEHQKFSLTVEVRDGESAEAAITGVEKLLEALKPIQTLNLGPDLDGFRLKVAEARAKQARKLFDNLDGASVWKDHKLDWDNEHQDDYQPEPDEDHAV